MSTGWAREKGPLDKLSDNLRLSAATGYLGGCLNTLGNAENAGQTLANRIESARETRSLWSPFGMS